MLGTALIAGCASVPSKPSIVAQWGPDRQWGKITLSGGRARFELFHLTGGTVCRTLLELRGRDIR